MKQIPPERKPFREWGLGVGIFLLTLLIMLSVASVLPYVSLFIGAGVFVWGIYLAAYKKRPYIFVGMVSAPVILSFIALIICGGFILISS